MKKEVIIAIVIGFSLGLIITFGVYTAQKALKSASTPTPTPLSASASPLPSHTLTLTAPEDEALLNQDKITLTGSTSANSLVTVLTETDQIVVYADASGQFVAPIKLTGGANDIAVTAITPDGTKAEAQITLVYSTAKIEP